MAGRQGFVLGTAFGADGERLYSCSIEGDIHFWDPARRLGTLSWLDYAGVVHAR